MAKGATSPNPFASTFSRSVILLATAIPAQVLANPIMLPGHALPGLPLALIVEIPIVAALFPGRRLRLALTCAAATSVTYTLNTLLFWVLGARQVLGAEPRGWGVLLVLFAGEAFATLAEAAAYAVASRELRRSLVASVLANVASFAVGFVVLAVLGGGAHTVRRR